MKTEIPPEIAKLLPPEAVRQITEDLNTPVAVPETGKPLFIAVYVRPGQPDCVIGGIVSPMICGDGEKSKKMYECAVKMAKENSGDGEFKIELRRYDTVTIVESYEQLDDSQQSVQA